MFTWLFHLLHRKSEPDQHQMASALFRTAGYLSLIILLHSAAMIQFEQLSLGDALWLSLTSITTVGYGDLYAQTFWGRSATALLIYLGGIFVLAKTAGDYFDYRAEKRRRQLRGEWIWNMHNHILIINTPAAHGAQYFKRLIEQFQSSVFARLPIQLLSREFGQGLPNSIKQIEQLTHYHGSATHPASLQAVNAQHAKLIVVLAKTENDSLSDSRTFDILHRLRETGTQANVLAECVDDQNRARLQKAGADIVIRPMRAYPGMIVRSFAAPGSEQIIENMFNSSSDQYHRFDIQLDHLSWSEIVCRLMQHDIGTAVAYVDINGTMHCNPSAHSPIECSALLLMMRENHSTDLTQLTHLLKVAP
ncbi:MAG: potassium channel family protein [Gammaproteobacteria bacterium]|nr:potassium channel family protein [Gammaproteobacteria bacterium]